MLSNIQHRLEDFSTSGTNGIVDVSGIHGPSLPLQLSKELLKCSNPDVDPQDWIKIYGDFVDNLKKQCWNSY